MSNIHFRHTTMTSPEQFIAGLTDLGSGGSERLDYRLSDPNRVVLTTSESTVDRGHSGYT